VNECIVRDSSATLAGATAGFQRTISDAYGKTLFDIQRGIGLGWRVDAMTPGAMREILHNPRSGQHYAARVWNNQNALAEWLGEDLTAGIASERPVAQLSRELSDRLGVVGGSAWMRRSRRR